MKTLSTNKELTYAEYYALREGEPPKQIAIWTDIEKHQDIYAEYAKFCRDRGIRAEIASKALKPLGLLPF